MKATIDRLFAILGVVIFTVLGGMGYGLIAEKIFKGREPWETLFTLLGLGVSIAILNYFLHWSNVAAFWTFLGAGAVFVFLRWLFGRGSALEMFMITHLFAISIFFGHSMQTAKEKADRVREMRGTLDHPSFIEKETR